MPAYLQLCIETWHHFLPGYHIVQLNYGNLFDYLRVDNLPMGTLIKNFSLPKQSDAIRCAVLHQNGGLWLDADTFILSRSAENFFSIDAEFVLIYKHIMYIMAKRNAYFTSNGLSG
jgi:mannosyltransferase OCH1-like enzyme